MPIERLSWGEYACYLAMAAESRSEDPMTHVGACVLSNKGKVLATGYNGLKPGMKVPEWMHQKEHRVRKATLFIHAEKNALKYVKDSDDPYLMGVSWSPCKGCAQEIVAMGIKKVFYINDWNGDRDFLDIFSFYGIEYAKLCDESLHRIKARFDASFEKAMNLRYPKI